MCHIPVEGGRAFTKGIQNIGKLMLYQLSYTRSNDQATLASARAGSQPAPVAMSAPGSNSRHSVASTTALSAAPAASSSASSDLRNQVSW